MIVIQHQYNIFRQISQVVDKQSDHFPW